MKKIVIPESVTSIGKSAFNDCASITSISIPNSVTTIGSNAFSDCIELTEVTIPNGIASINASCFSNCKKLASVNVPGSVTSIGNAAFSGCSMINNVYFAGTKTEWNNISIGTNNNSLVNATIHYAYYTVSVDEVNNGTVEVSKSKASAGEEITITATPNEGYIIGTITYNNNVVSGNSFIMPEDDVTVEVVFISKDTIEYLITLNETINGTATLPKEKACAGEVIVVSITADNGYMLDVINVNGKPIDGVSFVMPEENVTVEVIFKQSVASGKCGKNLTWSWDGTSTLTISGYGDMYDYDPDLIPDKWYGSDAPWGKFNFKITRIVFNGNITAIGSYAFCGCDKLTSIKIPNSVKYISYGAFDSCDELKNVTIPNSVISIDDLAFQSCEKLTNITIPESVTYLGEGAFCGSGLTSVTIPGSINYICDDAFAGCTNLCTVTIKDNVRSIRTGAFAGCKKLKVVYIPKTVFYIGDGAFEYCTSLSDIYYNDTKSGWRNISIEDDSIPYGVTIHYTGGPTSGKCGDNLTWTWDKNGTITISGSGSMYNFDCVDLDDDFEITAPWWDHSEDIKKVVISNGVTSIGDLAFSNCYSLNSISIPNSVKTIGANAFSECRNLEAVVIPEGVTTIKASAFEWCIGLERITLPNSVTYIGDYAFYGYACSSLTIHKNVKYIGEGAFAFDQYESGREIINLECVYFDGTEEEWKSINIDPYNDINDVPIHLADGSVIQGKNTLWARGKTVTIKYKKLRKKTQKLSRSKVMTLEDPQGKVTYKLASVSKKKYKKYFKVNASNGTVTVKKKLKKGTYTVKVKVTAAGNNDYKPLSRTVSIKIKVK